MKKLKTIAEVVGTVGQTPQQRTISIDAQPRVLDLLSQCDALATAVIRGASSGQMAQALSIARELAELERSYGVKFRR